MANPAEQPASTTSRIGKRPIPVPQGVAFSATGSEVQIKGPKGTMKRVVPDMVTVAQEGAELKVSTTAPGRSGARLQGLTRALVANMVEGVSKGFERVLELHGTGYRAELQGNDLHFALGFSHPIVYPVPEGVTATIPKDSKGGLLVLQGMDKAVVGQTAATIRGFRPPEPYGGKGVRYRGERVREKAGKAGK